MQKKNFKSIINDVLVIGKLTIINGVKYIASGTTILFEVLDTTTSFVTIRYYDKHLKDESVGMYELY